MSFFKELFFVITVLPLFFFPLMQLHLLLSSPPTLRLSHLSVQVFHYYAPVLDLAQLVNLADLPGFLLSNTQFELYPHFWNVGLCCYVLCVFLCVVPSPPTNRGLSGKSVKAKLLLDQMRSLRGKVFPYRLWYQYGKLFIICFFLKWIVSFWPNTPIVSHVHYSKRYISILLLSFTEL